MSLLASSLQGSDPNAVNQNVPPAQMATAVFVFRQIICLLFLTAWLVMFCFDNFFDQGEVLIPFWFNALAVGVLAFSLGVNVENLVSFKGISIIPTTAQQQQQPQYQPQPQPQPQPQQPRPYVPPDARQ